MWVAKLKFSSERTLLGAKAVEHNISMFGFPLSSIYENDWIIVQIAGTIFGEEKDKKKFVSDLKKNSRVIGLECADDFIVGTIKEPVYAKYLYNKNIVYVAPVFISEGGYEIMTISSFKREVLTKVADLLKKKYSGNLLSIQKKRIKSISVMKVRPELTEKQRKAMELALKHGYYQSPRKIDLQRLSRLAKLSFSTYQEHLRKAEAKLMPYFFE